MLHFLQMRMLAFAQAQPLLPRLVSNVLDLGGRSLITVQCMPELKEFLLDIHDVLLVRV